MAASRGVYGNIRVDYVVIRGGKQRLESFDLFLNCEVVDCNFSYDNLLPLETVSDPETASDADSSCGRGQHETPLERERLVDAYKRYITDRLKCLRKQPPGYRVLFTSSTYIPRPLIGITGPRTEMVSCFLNCFDKVYVVNGESLCNPKFVDKWAEQADEWLPPQHLWLTHALLDSYVPVMLSDGNELRVMSGRKRGERRWDYYQAYTEEHITYITMSPYVLCAKAVWLSRVGEIERKPECEYEIVPCLDVAFVYEWHSLQSKFMQNKLEALLAHIF